MKMAAIVFAKISGWILHLFHRGGSYPGQIALQLCPTILKRLQVHGEVIVITGTNGKTSTANMLAQSLKQANKKVISNAKGDNMRNGIVSTLISGATWKGYIDCDMVVLEVDELSLPYVMEHLSIDDIIITNFFRDQLDRAKEMEQLIQSLEASLHGFRGNLILNAHDPNTVRFAHSVPHAQCYFYGAEAQATDAAEEAKEGTFCPLCGNRLTYAHYQYSHIGTFACERCGFQTPINALMATDVAGKSFRVHFHTYEAPLDALYMIYNCMAVLCMFDVLHLEKQCAKKAFQTFVMPMGRNEILQDGRRTITLHLIKNPTGTNEVLKQIAKDESEHVVLFVLNDHPQDGTDVSWIYDSDFERIFHDPTVCIITAGSRAHEAALRMKYGGFKKDIIIRDDLKDALQAAREYPYSIYVLATYTALAPMRSVIGGVLK